LLSKVDAERRKNLTVDELRVIRVDASYVTRKQTVLVGCAKLCFPELFLVEKITKIEKLRYAAGVTAHQRFDDQRPVRN
jgi:hypothetical protein